MNSQIRVFQGLESTIYFDLGRNDNTHRAGHGGQRGNGDVGEVRQYFAARRSRSASALLSSNNLAGGRRPAASPRHSK